ncbi:unnamed protein product, partial [marine sediment metagenome]
LCKNVKFLLYEYVRNLNINLLKFYIVLINLK